MFSEVCAKLRKNYQRLAIWQMRRTVSTGTVTGTRNGRCKAMNPTTVNFLICLALFVLVVALTLGALMLVVPLVSHELTPSGYY